MNELLKKYPEQKDFIEKAYIAIKLAFWKLVWLVTGLFIIFYILNTVYIYVLTLHIGPAIQEAAQEQQQQRLEQQQQELLQQQQEAQDEQAEDDSEDESGEEEASDDSQDEE